MFCSDSFDKHLFKVNNRVNRTTSVGVADDDDSVYIVDIEQLFVQWDVYLPLLS